MRTERGETRQLAAAQSHGCALVPGRVGGPGRRRELILRAAVLAVLAIALSPFACAACLTWSGPVAPQPNADPLPAPAAQSSIRAQINETLVLSVVVLVIIRLLQATVRPLIRDEPWMRAYTARNIDATKQIFPSLKEELDSEANAAQQVDAFVHMCFIGVHHSLSAALVCPRLFGIAGSYFSDETAVKLVGHGALLELGLEVMDTGTLIWKVLFSATAGMRQLNLFGLAIVMMHHAMAMSLVIPMNLYYMDLLPYASLVFDLQFAAGAVTLLNSAAQTLDVSTTSGLLLQTLISVLMLVIMGATRVAYYWVPVYELLKHFIVVNDLTSFIVGVAVGTVIMPAFAYILIKDAWFRADKYMWKAKTAMFPTDSELEVPVGRRASNSSSEGFTQAWATFTTGARRRSFLRSEAPHATQA